jgi:hypothetical protein
MAEERQLALLNSMAPSPAWICRRFSVHGVSRESLNLEAEAASKRLGIELESI